VLKVVVAAQDVETINIIAESKPLKEALKSANLLKSLQFNTLISGERGTGRHTLASYMMPDALIVNGADPDIYTLIEKSDQIIIEEIEKIDSLSRLSQAVNRGSAKVIAIAEDPSSVASISSLFSVRIELPPLKEREEDIEPLAKKFANEILTLFGEKENGNRFVPNIESVDLSQNAFSLRRSIFLQFFAKNLERDELLYMNEVYLDERMDDSGDIYRKELMIYEVPLIRAGTRKFKSQLKMSQAFGLNRNTLRKKITEWKEYL